MNFRIVNSSNAALHLLNGGPQTLCNRSVTGNTMIPLSCFGRPADDAEWCGECARALAEIERVGVHKTTPAVLAKLRQIVANGESVVKAAETVGISYRTAKRHVSSEIRRFRVVPPEKLREAMRLVSEGSTQRNACRITGIDKATLCRALKRARVVQ